MKGLLGQVDNGQVSSLVITDPGGGYTGAIPKVLIRRRLCLLFRASPNPNPNPKPCLFYQQLIALMLQA